MDIRAFFEWIRKVGKRGQSMTVVRVGIWADNVDVGRGVVGGFFRRMSWEGGSSGALPPKGRSGTRQRRGR